MLSELLKAEKVCEAHKGTKATDVAKTAEAGAKEGKLCHFQPLLERNFHIQTSSLLQSLWNNYLAKGHMKCHSRL